MTSPYSIYSANMVIIAEKILQRIETAPSDTFTIVPAFTAYGDQDRLPSTPAVCVEPGDKDRTLEGVPNMTLNEFTIFVMVYHNKVQDNQLTRRECDMLAYEIEAYLHEDLQLTLGDPAAPALIHGFVRSNESGYSFKNGTLYRSARLTFYGKNKTSLADS